MSHRASKRIRKHLKLSGFVGTGEAYNKVHKRIRIVVGIDDKGKITKTPVQVNSLQRILPATTTKAVVKTMLRASKG